MYVYKLRLHKIESILYIIELKSLDKKPALDNKLLFKNNEVEQIIFVLEIFQENYLTQKKQTTTEATIIVSDAMQSATQKTITTWSVASKESITNLTSTMMIL